MATHAAVQVSMTALSPASHAQIIRFYSYHRLVQMFLDPDEGHRVSHLQDIPGIKSLQTLGTVWSLVS